MSNNIVIYTKSMCPSCAKAKNLLKSKNMQYQEIDIENSEQLTNEMVQKSGRKTVPQIFINGHHVGGYDDLHAADKSGELDKILQSN